MLSPAAATHTYVALYFTVLKLHLCQGNSKVCGRPLIKCMALYCQQFDKRVIHVQQPLTFEILLPWILFGEQFR